MKKATLFFKNTGMATVEYSQEDAERIMFELHKLNFVTFDKRTIRCDEIEQIVWID